MAFDDSQVLREPCTTQTPYLHQYLGECKEHTVIIRDDDGNPIDLTDIGPCTEASTKWYENSSSSSNSPAVVEVLYQASSGYAIADNIVSTTAVQSDPVNGEVTIRIDETAAIQLAGLYLSS